MSKAITIIQNPEPIGNPGGSIYPPGYSAVSILGNQYSRLEELSEDYQTYLGEEGFSEDSVITYANEIGRFLGWLGGNPQAISRQTFVSYRDDLKARYSPSTANLALVGIRQYLNWLYDIGEIPNNPALGVKGVRQKGRSKAHKRDALTPGEVRRLLGSIPGDSALDARNRAIIAVMLYGGLRSIEVRRAVMGDYRTKQDKRVLFIQGKGRESADEYIVISPDLEEIIGNWLRYHPAGDDPKAPLFPSLSRRSFGGPLTSSPIRRMVKAKFREAGIRDSSKTTHSLRHSAITAVIRGGGTLPQAQSFARHSSPETTQIYIHEAERIENPPEFLIQY